MDCSTNSIDILKLLISKRMIEECLRVNREDIQMLEASRQVGVNDMLKESLQIQFNCHAPKEYTVGMPLFRSHPPAPQPEEMRVGALPTYNKTLNKITKSENADVRTTGSFEGTTVLKKLRIELSSKRSRLLAEQSRESSSNHLDAPFGIAGKVENKNSEDVAEADLHTSVKKARTVNISFGMSDSEDSEDD